MYTILKNPIYIGRITHKKNVYDAQHEAIIPQELWQQVQENMASQRVEHKTKRVKHGNLLRGKCVDLNGHAFTPTFTVKNKTTQYCYYINKQQKQRISGLRLESLVFDIIRHTSNQSEYWESCWDMPGATHAKEELRHRGKTLWDNWDRLNPIIKLDIAQMIIDRIIIMPESMLLRLSYAGIIQILQRSDLTWAEPSYKSQVPKLIYQPEIHSTETTLEVRVPMIFQSYGNDMHAIDPAGKPLRAVKKAEYDHTLINALAKSYRWNQMLTSGQYTIADIVRKENVSRSYLSRILSLMLLAPDIIESILNGTQPPTLKLKEVMKALPMEWEGQREMLFISSQ